MANFMNWLQTLLYPQIPAPTVQGHGVDLRHRFPKLSSEELKEIQKPTERAKVVLVGLITGLFCGVAASVLKLSIATVSRWLTSTFQAGSTNWWFIVLPIVGVLLAGIYQRYIIRMNIYHGEDRMRWDFAHYSCYLPSQLIYSPIIGATLTLAFGGSAGSEGPIAYSGGAIGSNVAAWLRTNPKTVRAMLAIGAGAGIAGIFKAPIGGALFTIEVLGLGLGPVSVIALIVACVASALTAFLISGNTFDIPFNFSTTIAIDHYWMLILFGIFCGIYSVYYSHITEVVARWMGKLKNPWIKNASSGLLIGVLLFLCPALYGEGYGVLGHLLNADYSAINAGGIFHGGTLLPAGTSAQLLMVLAALLTVLAKAFATSATNNGGGVAGSFAPTIMIGGVLGFLFAFTLRTYTGIDIPVPDYVFLGMAGILSGVIRAPLMSMFLITEMAAMGFQQFLPVAIVATLSYVTLCAVNLIFRTIRPSS